MSENNTPDFGIEIKFSEHENPARAFRTLSELLEAFQHFDEDLVNSIDSNIKPIILLEDLQKGSIRAWLKNTIEAVPDDGLKELDWKKAVGHYLVKGKYSLIKYLEGKTEITDRNGLLQLEEELYLSAKETNVNKMPVYAPIPTDKLISNIERITTATKHLKIGSDSLEFIVSENTKTTFNLEFNFAPESIIDLVTKQTLQSEQEMILKVKKPDYLGESKWELRHQRTPIEAKITDLDWLSKFQNREVNVRPGDSIRAKVRITVKYDFSDEVIATVYEIVEIKEVILTTQGHQIELPISD